jgi:uncharacterized protein (DUF58 family)
MAQKEFHTPIEGMDWADRLLARLNLSVILLFIIVILFLIAWNRGIVLLYGALWVLVCIYVVAWSYPRLGLGVIRIERNVAEKAHEGEHIEITYELHNSAFFSRYLIELRDFTNLFDNGIFMLIPKLAGTKTLRYEAECSLRGVHHFGDVELQSGFPLGVSIAKTSVAMPKQTLIVYPRPEPVRRLYGGGDRSSSLHEDFYMERAGGHEEFIGLREYRAGDSPRTIHWPTSAKKGELVVREYHENVSPRLTIILNLNRSFDAGEGKDSILEYSVKIAASLGVAALQEGWRVDLVGMGKELWHLRELSGEKERMTLLEALAQVRCDGEASYEDVLNYTVSSGVRGGTVVLFDRLDTPLKTTLHDRRDFFIWRYSFDALSFGTSYAKVVRNQDASAPDGRHQVVKKGVSWEGLFA